MYKFFGSYELVNFMAKAWKTLQSSREKQFILGKSRKDKIVLDDYIHFHSRYHIIPICEGDIHIYKNEEIKQILSI